MKQIDLTEEAAQRSFAEEAAKCFAEHEMAEIYGDIEAGKLIALRWGIGRDCVLVLKLDAGHEPTNYVQAVGLAKSSNAPHERAAEGRPLDAVVGRRSDEERNV